MGCCGRCRNVPAPKGGDERNNTDASATPHALALSAIGDRLVVVHEEYGARVLWLASGMLDDPWQVTRLSTPSSVIVEANPLLQDPQTDMVMLLGAASQQGQRLSRLINTLMDVARINMGHLTLERATLDLAHLTQRVVEEIRLLMWS